MLKGTVIEHAIVIKIVKFLVFLVGPVPVEPFFSAINIANMGGKSSQIAKVLRYSKRDGF